MATTPIYMRKRNGQGNIAESRYLRTEDGQAITTDDSDRILFVELLLAFFVSAVQIVKTQLGSQIY